MVTEPIEGIVSDMPGIRDPDRLTYFKEEVGGLAAGGYELNPIPYDGEPSVDDPEFRLFPEMTEHFAQFMPGMVERFPQLETVGIKRWFRGLDSFTEDTHFILGELPEVRGLFCACGFNAMGIAAGGGAGMALPSGCGTANHRSICGRSTSVGSVRITVPIGSSVRECWKDKAIIT